jgi:glutaredoxin
MLKKILILVSAFLFLAIAHHTNAQRAERQAMLYFFWGDGCPHCAAEEAFLEKIQPQYPTLKVQKFEVWYNRQNQKLMAKILEKLGQNNNVGVPLTIIGNEVMVGYLNDEQNGAWIENRIKTCLNQDCSDLVASILKEASSKPAAKKIVDWSKVPEKIKLPLFGEVRPQNVSLPFLTMVVGLLDGFNPCAMWTLVFLITLLLGMKNRRRMWLLGSVFIFMAAWLNLLLFIGFIVWVRALIGLVAVGSGVYNLKEFFTNKEAVCKVTKGEDKKKIFERIKDIVRRDSFWLALGGIILLGATVNLVELVCSAGFPAIYTQVLTLSGLPAWQYYLYLAGYIFFYMLDDMIVFVVAMATLRLAGASSKYTRASHLIGGILIVIIGILLIFKPQWLMFG